MQKPKLYILNFRHNNGNGYALVNANSPNQASAIFKAQTIYTNATIITTKESRWYGEENQLIKEGAVTTLGKSVYDIAVLNGFTGSMQDFIDSLKGEKGDTFVYEDLTEAQKNDLARRIPAITSVEYSSYSKEFLFHHTDNSTSRIDASAFIKDGMVDTVEIVDNNILITFNTDAGHEGISIPITDIFNPNNYYNKTESDARYLQSFTETDPTVPSWAKQPTKPSYSYNEITNTPTIPTVPTNVSAFTNDAGYLTQHQSLANYYDKDDVDDLLEDKAEEFIVNVSYNGSAYSADKTLQECITAFGQGLQVVFTRSGDTGIVENYIAVRRLSTSYGGQYYRTIWAFGVNGSIVQILKYDDSGITLSLAPAVIDNLTSTSTTGALSANQGRVLKGLVDGKQDTLVSGTTIKTINSQSVLGNGDIAVATPTDLATYCPIIEDTRSSAVAAITGVAPFASLVDGQRIIIVNKYMATSGNASINLTLSNGSPTGDIPVFCTICTAFARWNFDAYENRIRVGAYLEFVFDSANTRWVLLGYRDTNNTYSTMPQTEITAGTATTGKLISAKLLCDNFQKHTAIVTMPSGAVVPTDGYEPNKMYDFGKVASVTFATYDTSKEIANAVNLYMCTFVVASGGTTLNLNANIKYPNGDDGTELANLLTTEDRVFEITIRDNKLSFLYFD